MSIKYRLNREQCSIAGLLDEWRTYVQPRLEAAQGRMSLISRNDSDRHYADSQRKIVEFIRKLAKTMRTSEAIAGAMAYEARGGMTLPKVRTRIKQHGAEVLSGTRTLASLFA